MNDVLLDYAVAVCAGCGCSDLKACEGGCSWLAVARHAGTGVCSRCPRHLTAWRNQRAEVGPRDFRNGTLDLVQVGPTDKLE